jgi:lysophospholipase L1-like esterase
MGMKPDESTAVVKLATAHRWGCSTSEHSKGSGQVKKAIVAIAALVALAIAYQLLRPKPDIDPLALTGENIICFGDSLTSGYGALTGKDYPAQLSRLLGRPVINAGVAGDTTGRALQRLEQDVLSRSPRIVLITLGGNDLKNRIARETAFDNLKRIVESIQDAGALVIVGGIDLPLFGRGFGKGYENVVDETGAILVPDILEGIFGNQRLMSDPIHPNDDGYALMARRFYEAIPANALP